MLKRIGVALTIGTLALPVAAQTLLQERLKGLQADPVALKASVEAGRKAAFFCANCHGENGISKTSDVPNLAGQNPAFLLEQIRKFGSGERKDAFMQGLIKVLKDDQPVQISLFYAAAALPPSPADARLAAQGKQVFDKLCVRCHGEQAHGNGEIPRIAGQKLAYLQTSITRYRDGTGIRNNQLMSIATAQLKNDDILAIANYLTQLP
jgi:cytochrome c553